MHEIVVRLQIVVALPRRFFSFIVYVIFMYGKLRVKKGGAPTLRVFLFYEFGYVFKSHLTLPGEIVREERVVRMTGGPRLPAAAADRRGGVGGWGCIANDNDNVCIFFFFLFFAHPGKGKIIQRNGDK